MPKEISYTIEEVSQFLKVSKLTVYDLVKKGELPVFRVGRQMRIAADDLDKFINRHKNRQGGTFQAPDGTPESPGTIDSPAIVISGQDLVLDILGKHIEKNSSFKALRSYSGSLNSLISMYHGEGDVVSLHLFDGDTGDYNVPYLKKILTGHSYILLNLLSRKAGLYVRKGNPKSILKWSDLERQDIIIVNREKGSGARILLDEQLRLLNLVPGRINGYSHEETSHLSVAAAVSSGAADAGVGIEKAAKIVGVDFVPLITERYDLVLLKQPNTDALIGLVKGILSSPLFQNEINRLGDYDTSMTGKIIFETY